jgi:transposase
MKERQALAARIAVLERIVAEQRAQVAEKRTEIARLRQELAQRDARIAALEAELRERTGKKYRPKPNVAARRKGKQDRRRKRFRQHPGVFRPEPTPDANTIQHDVRLNKCLHCGSARLKLTGEYIDHLVHEIPQPKVELHCYRRHEYHCADCERTCAGRGDLELPGAHVGPRARLLTGYARGYLGISLEKTCTLLDDLFGLSLSRAGALGHLRWGSSLCQPVVAELLTLLRESAVIHADETGWRINGKNVWAWCFCNPKLAVFLIDRRRSAEVLRRALGDSLPGVLVSDFYAAYGRIECRKQRCLVHLLRDLYELRETLAATFVTRHVQPLIALFQDAIRLGQRREQLAVAAFDRAHERILERFWRCLERRSKHADCERIYARLERHFDELFTFLEHPEVPSDNNPGERDIRSLAAARSDGGVNRTDWGADAFARIKSVVRTCQKNGRNYFEYGLSLVRATLAGASLPLPLDSS